MTVDTPIRCGDHVFHVPSGETWVVAYVEDDRLAWCGWPDGTAALDDCTRVHACSDAEHLKLLRELAAANTGRRSIKARAELQRLDPKFLSEHANGVSP